MPSGAIVGVRYVNLFLNPCHPSCETCSGPKFDQCLTCWPSSASTLYSGSCLCDSTNYYIMEKVCSYFSPEFNSDRKLSLSGYYY